MLRGLKAMGFSDRRLAELAGKQPRTSARCARALDVHPAYKRIDTCAAEFASPTAYMYSTYETPFAGAVADEARPSDRQKLSSSAAAPTASARASSSTIAAAMPPLRWRRRL